MAAVLARLATRLRNKACWPRPRLHLRKDVRLAAITPPFLYPASVESRLHLQLQHDGTAAASDMQREVEEAVVSAERGAAAHGNLM